MTLVRVVLGLLLVARPLVAETVTWVPEREIDCPVQVAVEDEALSRSVIFPDGGRITSVNADWLDPTKISLRVVRNAVEIRLRDPAYIAHISMFDDRGNAYTLGVHAADRDEPIDQRLIVVAPTPQFSRKPFPLDTDQGAIVLMRHMVGGERSQDIQESPITRVEGDKMVAGELVPSSDAMLTVMRMRLYQAPGIKGYTYTYTWNGEESMRVNLSSVWPVGARWVSSVGQALYPDGRSEVVLYPHRPITVCYVGWYATPGGR